jgi:hypothetical protein
MCTVSQIPPGNPSEPAELGDLVQCACRQWRVVGRSIPFARQHLSRELWRKPITHQLTLYTHTTTPLPCMCVVWVWDRESL